VTEGRHDFLSSQIVGLQPFDYVVVGLIGPDADAVRVSRDEEGAYVVEVAERLEEQPFTADQLSALESLGFTSPGWKVPVAGAPEAVALTDRLLREVFAAPEDAPVDVQHGSRRAEHEAEEQLERVRARIVPVLTEMLGHPPQQDSDGDYLFDYESTQVYVAPRAAPGVPPIIRVFSITNIGVNVTPELGMFLSRLNFSLTFGRFALDVEHRAVWFDETLLGDGVSDDVLKFTIGIVADTADEWDDQISRLFGGITRQVAAQSATQPVELPAKPGQGGYL
jgi:hypothetical protein